MFETKAQFKINSSKANQQTAGRLFFTPFIQPVNNNGSTHSTVQRKCAACESEEKELQKKESGNATSSDISPLVEQTLQSSGKTLDESTRSFMEERFGYDFSKVQIHNDAAANKSSEDLNALAYTHDNHIVFGAGQYHPQTDSGKKLLAHELTHVVQQNKDMEHREKIQQYKRLTSRPEEKNFHETFVQRSDGGSYLPASPSPGTEIPDKEQPGFEVGSGNINKRDIKDTLRDEGNSFSFGWVNPALFSWENEVAIHGATGTMYGNWVVGVLQLMKDYWINIWWGDETDKVHCGDKFPEVNIRDVKNSIGGSAWFDDLTTSAPFTNDGDKKSTKIEDSPGALYVPYHHPEQKSDKNFGNFDFGCTFFTYISAFNYADPLSSEAWQHLKSVYWQTMLAGSFDGRLPSDQRVKITSGGTTDLGNVNNGFPQKYPPKLSGLAALDKICPVTQCWSPTLKCNKIIIP